MKNGRGEENTVLDVVVVIAEYKRYLSACGYAEKTVAAYRLYLEKFARYLHHCNIRDLRNVSHQVIIDYQAHVASRKLALESKALNLRPVKRLFEHLVRSHKLLINPCDGIVETCRKRRRLGTVLSLKDVGKLLDQPNLSLGVQLRDRAVMELFYATGIRLSELISLKTHDAELSDKTLFIRKAKGRAQRVVPMGKRAAGYLKEYLEKIRPHHARNHLKERSLFLNVHGRPLTAGSVQGFIRKYGIAAGIEHNASPHTLRRSCATHMLAAGADIRSIQQLLGHRRLDTTQSYTRIMPADVKQAHAETHPNNKER